MDFMNSLKNLGTFVKFLNIWCYLSTILIDWINCPSVNLCIWLCRWTSQFICSVFLLWKPLRTYDHNYVVLWSENSSLERIGLRLLMSSSDRRQAATGTGVVTAWLRRQRKYTNIAPTLWSSLSRRVRNVRKRGRYRWQRAWLFALFWRKSVNQNDRLISLICSPCHGPYLYRSMVHANYKWILVYWLGPSHEVLCSATNQKQTSYRGCSSCDGNLSPWCSGNTSERQRPRHLGN